MAPAAAVAFSIIVGANFAAGALPLSVLFALVGCLLVAVSIGRLARQLPSTGGFYTYAARDLHPAVGFPGRLGLRLCRRNRRLMLTRHACSSGWIGAGKRHVTRP
jgi:amino acid transporter